MRRRWIADTVTPETGHPTHAALLGDQAAHLARVLRAAPGQVFDVVAAGFLHRAEILTVTPARVDFLLHEELQSDSALPLHLYLAVFKFDHFEWAIEKATELGVSRITPILARRTEKHLAQSSAKRVERWRRIAHEASQQSRRTSIPTISDPIPLKPALDREQAPTRILLSETEQSLTLSAALLSVQSLPASRYADASASGFASRYVDASVSGFASRYADASASGFASRYVDASVSGFASRYPEASASGLSGVEESKGLQPLGYDLALAIGPEGGWTPEEMQLFTHHHWTPVTLGPRILRAETAAIAAIAIAGTFLS